MRSLRIAVATATIAAGLAVLPAAGQARVGPEPICVFTVEGMICTGDAGTIAHEVVSDPVGYVCSNPALTCGPARNS